MTMLRRSLQRELVDFLDTLKSESVDIAKVSKAACLGIISKKITCRLTKILLDSGETEVLLTSLIAQSKHSISALKELYRLRWGVETSYGALKHKAELENFSGKSINNIKQAYYAKIFILNYTALLIQPIDRLLAKKTKRIYHHQVNLNEALARMKYAVVDLFLLDKILQALKKLFESFYAFTKPIRKYRKFNRPKLPKRK